MKTYKVLVGPEAKKQMRRHLAYIKNKLKNPQAAESVYDDFIASAGKLSIIAGSVKEPEDAELIRRGLKRMNFERHEYFMLYKVDDDEAKITNVFHFRENFIAKLK
ncbi:MAG: hypothetical protein IKO07_07205 [Clostridia bacterium]|nr:hypothetical protein [Clostridia bacterium]